VAVVIELSSSQHPASESRERRVSGVSLFGAFGVSCTGKVPLSRDQILSSYSLESSSADPLISEREKNSRETRKLGTIGRNTRRTRSA